MFSTKMELASFFALSNVLWSSAHVLNQVVVLSRFFAVVLLSLSSIITSKISTTTLQSLKLHGLGGYFNP